MKKLFKCINPRDEGDRSELIQLHVIYLSADGEKNSPESFYVQSMNNSCTSNLKNKTRQHIYDISQRIHKTSCF